MAWLKRKPTTLSGMSRWIKAGVTGGYIWPSRANSNPPKVAPRRSYAWALWANAWTLAGIKAAKWMKHTPSLSSSDAVKKRREEAMRASGRRSVPEYKPRKTSAKVWAGSMAKMYR